MGQSTFILYFNKKNNASCGFVQNQISQICPQISPICDYNFLRAAATRSVTGQFASIVRFFPVFCEPDAFCCMWRRRLGVGVWNDVCRYWLHLICYASCTEVDLTCLGVCRSSRRIALPGIKKVAWIWNIITWKTLLTLNTGGHLSRNEQKWRVEFLCSGC